MYWSGVWPLSKLEKSRIDVSESVWSELSSRWANLDDRNNEGRGAGSAENLPNLRKML